MCAPVAWHLGGETRHRSVSAMAATPGAYKRYLVRCVHKMGCLIRSLKEKRHELYPIRSDTEPGAGSVDRGQEGQPQIAGLFPILGRFRAVAEVAPVVPSTDGFSASEAQAHHLGHGVVQAVEVGRELGVALVCVQAADAACRVVEPEVEDAVRLHDVEHPVVLALKPMRLGCVL